MFDFFFGTAISKNSSERVRARRLYLFSKTDNYCCGRAVEGQLLKFIGRNTVTFKHWYNLIEA